jgi:hypothetical protein
MQADEGTKKEVLKFTDLLRNEGIHTERELQRMR